MRDAYKPPTLVPVLYFLSSLFASATVASFIADVRTLVFWLGYLWVRQGEARALLATFVVAAMALPSCVSVLQLLS